jgi:hypothetical protein
MKRRNTPEMRRLERGSQLAELAIALPILFLIVFGIWDFGSAFALKQKLTNAASQGARIIVSTPDCLTCNGTPPRIQAAASAVVTYLENDGLQGASCISPSSPTSSASYTNAAGTTIQYQWVYTCNGITLQISHGDGSGNGTFIPVTEPDGSVAQAPATQVTLSYPLTWRAESLLPEPVPSAVSTQVTMENLVP